MRLDTEVLEQGRQGGFGIRGYPCGCGRGGGIGLVDATDSPARALSRLDLPAPVPPSKATTRRQTRCPTRSRRKVSGARRRIEVVGMEMTVGEADDEVESVDDVDHVGHDCSDRAQLSQHTPGHARLSPEVNSPHRQSRSR